MTWHKAYNQLAMEHFDRTGWALNHAGEYWDGVFKRLGEDPQKWGPRPQINPLRNDPALTPENTLGNLVPGKEYLAVIGMFHPTGFEGTNIPAIFVELLNKKGNRMMYNSYPLNLYYEWVGMTIEQKRTTDPVRIDKPFDLEPGANIFLTWDMIVRGFHVNTFAFDQFSHVHTRYPSDGYGLDQAHHRTYIVLQVREWPEVWPDVPNPDHGGVDPKPPPVEPPPVEPPTLQKLDPPMIVRNEVAWNEAGNLVITTEVQTHKTEED